MSGLREYLAGANDGPGGTRGGPKPCKKCGAPRPPGLGRGRRYCDPCQAELDASKACVRCGAPKPPGRGWRLCATCERVKGRMPCPGCGTRDPKAPRSRYCTGCRDMMVAASRIRACARRRLKAKQCRGLCGRKGPFRLPTGKNTPYCTTCRAKRFAPTMCTRCHANPTRGSHKLLCSTCYAAAKDQELARRRVLDAGYRAQRKALGKKRAPGKPGAAAAKNEARRMRRRLVAEANGKHLTPVAEPRPSGGGASGEFPMLPAGPLADLIERLIDQESIGAFDRGVDLVFIGERGGRVTRKTPDPTNGLPSPREAVCERIGVATKSQYDWSHGVRRTVQFDVADRVLSRARVPWWDVWKACGKPACDCETCQGAALARHAFEGEAAA